MKRLPRWAQLAIGFLVLYWLVFFALAWRKYAVFGADSGEFALFDNVFWNSSRGRLFYSDGRGISNLGVHTEFLWIKLVPFYWLVPGIPTLLFFQSLFITAAALPVFLIARDVLRQNAAAVVFGFAFLFLPPIVSQHLNQVEMPPFLAFYLLFAYWFFLRGWFGWFLVAGALACLGRENIPLTFAMFGIYAWFLRRDWKWVLTPLLIGLSYFTVAMWVLLPYFQEGKQWHVMRMFTYLGNTRGEIIRNALTRPDLILAHLAGRENINYLFLLLQPLGWLLPFFSLAVLLALPDLLLNLISDNNAMKVIPWHYNVVTGSFLLVAAIHATAKLGQHLRARLAGNPELIVAGLLALLSLAHWLIWFNPAHLRRLPHHDTLKRALAAVPADKSVLAPIRIVAHVARREHFGNVDLFLNHPEYAAQFEYVILDANERAYGPPITREFFDRFYRNPNYQLVFAETNVFVFQRLGGESDWKIPVP